VVKQFHFPRLEGCTFIPEGLLWQQIDRIYDEFYVNTIFRIYHRFEGTSLSNREKSVEQYKNDYYVNKFQLTNESFRPKYLSRTYLLTLYFLKVNADRAHIEKKELLFRLKGIDKLSLFIFTVPIKYLRKRRGEL